MAGPAHFTVIPIGAEGGLTEGNLSAYLLAVPGQDAFVCLDAGTIKDGLTVAARRGCFAHLPHPSDDPLSLEGAVLQRHVKAYLISHGYLDHVEGLVEASPTDTAKPIYSLAGVIDDLRNHLFNWRLWPNFADSGVAPCLDQYRYQILEPGRIEALPLVGLTVEAHPLAHGPFTDSVAFLLAHAGHTLLYMGDTGPDAVEGRDTTARLWRRIAPLIRDGRLHAIFIECSYANGRPDDTLYSHLTPAWLERIFAALADEVGAPLTGLNVVITHIKPNFAAGEEQAAIVRRQLAPLRDLGLILHFAEQGVPLEL